MVEIILDIPVRSEDEAFELRAPVVLVQPSDEFVDERPY
jgi:hypothetical protein